MYKDIKEAVITGVFIVASLLIICFCIICLFIVAHEVDRMKRWQQIIEYQCLGVME